LLVAADFEEVCDPGSLAVEPERAQAAVGRVAGEGVGDEASGEQDPGLLGSGGEGDIPALSALRHSDRQ
jgi:hypothetical protein